MYSSKKRGKPIFIFFLVSLIREIVWRSITLEFWNHIILPFSSVFFLAFQKVHLMSFSWRHSFIPLSRHYTLNIFSIFSIFFSSSRMRYGAFSLATLQQFFIAICFFRKDYLVKESKVCFYNLLNFVLNFYVKSRKIFKWTLALIIPRYIWYFIFACFSNSIDLKKVECWHRYLIHL